MPSEPLYCQCINLIGNTIVRKVKTEKGVKNPIRLKNKAMATNGNIIRIDVYKVEEEGYYFVPIYMYDIVAHKLPNKACVSGKGSDSWIEMDEKNFIFSLYSKDLIYIKPRRPLILHSVENEKETTEVEDILAYYVRADISTACILLMDNDNLNITRGIGVKTLEEFKKYEVDVLGNYHEVKLPEKRQYFNKKQKN